MNKTWGLLWFLLAGAQWLAAAEPESRDNGQSAPPPLAIAEVVRLALAHAPDAALARSQVARAQESLREVRSLNRPQVVIGSGMAYNNGFPLSIEGAAPSIFQVGFTQAIFSKKNSSLIREAEQSLKGGDAGAESARNELAARTAVIYCELSRARKLADLWTARREAAQAEEKIVAALLEAGRVKPLDLTLARTLTSQAQQQVLMTSEQARLAEVELTALTGLPAGSRITVIEPEIDSPVFTAAADGLYLRTLEASPELRQAESDLQSKEFHIEAEKGESRPRLEIVSQYALFSRANNYADFFQRFERNNFIVGLSVQFPIFDGSRTGARVAQSRHLATEAQLRVQSLKQGLRLNIERGLSALRVARGAAQFARMEISAARENLEVNRTLLEAGRISPKEFAGAQLQVSEKEMAAIESEKILNERKIDLLRLAGALTTVF
jgi:outer membrane protein